MEVSKQCTGCKEVLPLSCYRPVRRKTMVGCTAECKDCENVRRRNRRGKTAVRPAYRMWTAVEDSLLRTLYPSGGYAAAVAVMPDRNEVSIRARAHRLGLSHLASKYSHPSSACEPAVPLPAPHDYAPEDHAWMATRLPVYGSGFGAARISA